MRRVFQEDICTNRAWCDAQMSQKKSDVKPKRTLSRQFHAPDPALHRIRLPPLQVDLSDPPEQRACKQCQRCSATLGLCTVSHAWFCTLMCREQCCRMHPQLFQPPPVIDRRPPHRPRKDRVRPSKDDKKKEKKRKKDKKKRPRKLIQEPEAADDGDDDGDDDAIVEVPLMVAAPPLFFGDGDEAEEVDVEEEVRKKPSVVDLVRLEDTLSSRRYKSSESTKRQLRDTRLVWQRGLPNSTAEVSQARLRRLQEDRDALLEVYSEQIRVLDCEVKALVEAQHYWLESKLPGRRDTLAEWIALDQKRVAKLRAVHQDIARRYNDLVLGAEPLPRPPPVAGQVQEADLADALLHIGEPDVNEPLIEQLFEVPSRVESEREADDLIGQLVMPYEDDNNAMDVVVPPQNSSSSTNNSAPPRSPVKPRINLTRLLGTTPEKEAPPPIKVGGPPSPLHVPLRKSAVLNKQKRKIQPDPTSGDDSSEGGGPTTTSSPMTVQRGPYVPSKDKRTAPIRAVQLCCDGFHMVWHEADPLTDQRLIVDGFGYRYTSADHTVRIYSQFHDRVSGSSVTFSPSVAHQWLPFVQQRWPTIKRHALKAATDDILLVSNTDGPLSDELLRRIKQGARGVRV